MKAPDKPLVSIVIPCLNRAQFLVPTVESVLQQDYPYIECIVVDGGSTDGTIGILKRYGDRIRWVSEKDDGHADAINKGWKMSKGEILAWLNADDVYVVPDAISKAVDCFQNDPEIDVIYGDSGLIDENGRLRPYILRPRVWDLARSVKYCDHIIFQASSFMRRRILEKVNWLDPSFKYGKDRELWLRIGLLGKIRYVPVHFANTNICQGISQHGLPVSECCIKLTEKFFKAPDLPSPYTSPRFQRRALSNAYLVGSLYAWDGGRCVKRVLDYIFKSFLTDPSNLPYLFLAFPYHIILSLLPEYLKIVLKRISDYIRGRRGLK
jgi:glycosyltransferase involved in cell wall biosynthesis